MNDFVLDTAAENRLYEACSFAWVKFILGTGVVECHVFLPYSIREPLCTQVHIQVSPSIFANLLINSVAHC